MTKTAIITGASSGFGALIARSLADDGHIVYAGMRDISGRNVRAAADAREYTSKGGSGRLIPVEMDILSQDSVDAAVAAVLDNQDHIDVVVHNAGHMVTGPTEAFTVEQIAHLY